MTCQTLSLPKSVCFTDETAIYLTAESPSDGQVLQKDLDTLSGRESRWDMEFNPSKCQVVRVTASRRPINTLYYLNGQVLEAVTSARYLGVDISSGLSELPHRQNNRKRKQYTGLPQEEHKDKTPQSERDCLQHTSTSQTRICLSHMGPS